MIEVSFEDWKAHDAHDTLSSVEEWTPNTKSLDSTNTEILVEHSS